MAREDRVGKECGGSAPKVQRGLDERHPDCTAGRGLRVRQPGHDPDETAPLTTRAVRAPHNRPVWEEAVPPIAYEEFACERLPARCRVAVIGGGVIGLACAYSLARAGLGPEVVLLERGRFMEAASGGNGGGLWPAAGGEGNLAFCRLASHGLQLLEELARTGEFDLELRRNGVLAPAWSPGQADELQREVAAVAEARLPATWLSPAKLAEVEPVLACEEVYGAAHFPADAHANPAAVGLAFARGAQAAGAHLCCRVEVAGFEEHSHTTHLFTSAGMLDAAHVVVAAGPWTPALSALLRLEVPIRPARGQLIAYPVQPPLLHNSIRGPCSVLQLAGGRVVAGGNVELDEWGTEPDPQVSAEFHREASRILPPLAQCAPTHSWARLRPHTPDGLPLVGRCGSGERHFVAAGHHRNGLLLSAITGSIVTDLLLRGESDHPLEALRPDRFAGATAARHNPLT